jgi:(4-alkanoyl-5-oxo-2,5-dihydrofuran-3-yl)methyl phosphate reductase
LAAEQQIEATGLAWTMLRPGNFASNTLRWAPMIKAQGAVFAPAGPGKSAVIDPYDIASVAAKALTTPGHEGQRYVLTGPELLSAAEQIDIIGAELGKPLRLVSVPEAGAKAKMLESGMNEVLVDALLELVSLSRSGGEARLTSAVRDVTGADPRTFAAWVRAHRAAFA